MNCKQIQENLSAYLDDALIAEEADEINSHLPSCPDCQKVYKDLKETVAMLSSLEEEIPPAGFRRELYKKLEEERTAPVKTSVLARLSDRVRKLNRYQLMPAAAVVVILLLAVPLLKDSVPFGAANKVGDGAPQTTAKYNLRAQFKEDLANTTDSAGGAGFAGKNEAFNKAGEAPDVHYRLAIGPQASVSPDSGYIERKVIKNADISLNVEKYDAAVAEIKNKVAAAGGYISNESGTSSGAEEIRSGHLQVRMPSAQFEDFLAGMDLIGRVKSRNIYSDDVTEEYVDIESRLKAMRTKEERLLAILSSSGKLSDILAVENELANTRAQLESLQGRLRYLNNRTEFSNIGISIEQVAVSVQQISAGGWKGVLLKAKEAFVSAVNNIIKDAGKLVVFISSALPYLVLAIIVVYGSWLMIRKKRS